MYLCNGDMNNMHIAYTIGAWMEIYENFNHNLSLLIKLYFVIKLLLLLIVKPTMKYIVKFSNMLDVRLFHLFFFYRFEYNFIPNVCASRYCVVSCV